MTSSRPSNQRHGIALRLTFAHEVSPESVIQHLLETFNDDGSLLEAVAELTTRERAAERTTAG